MSTYGHRSDTITRARHGAALLFEAVEELYGAKVSWDGGVAAQIINASGTDPKAVGYTPGDFAGSHEGLVKADITQALGAALTALMVFVNSADGKKLEDIRP